MAASNLKDITGNRFGKLLVLKRDGTDVQGSAMWLCKCDCGNEKTIRSPSLLRGATKSCGCMQVGPRLPDNLAEKNRHYLSYSGGANRRGYSFDITKEYFLDIITKPCNYCGDLGSIKGMFNGIDRLDNDLGYTVENTVPCCKFCNQAKHTYSLEFFLSKCKEINKYNEGD